MRQIAVVVEKKTMVKELRGILSRFKAIRYFAADHKMGLISLARNIIVHERIPVVLITHESLLNSKALIDSVAGGIPSLVMGIYRKANIACKKIEAFKETLV